jgi:hypothetical protein
MIAPTMPAVQSGHHCNSTSNTNYSFYNSTNDPGARIIIAKIIIAVPSHAIISSVEKVIIHIVIAA